MKVIIATLLLVIAAALGLLVGKIFRSKPAILTLTSLEQTQTNPGPSNNLVSKTNALTQPTSFASKLDFDLSMSTGVTKWLYWLEALEKAGLNDFPALYLKAKNNPQMTRLIALKWIEKNPRHCFDTLVLWTKAGNSRPANELSYTLFQEWTEKDPHGVIEAMTEEKSFINQRMSVSGMIVRTDPELGLKLMSEWRIDSYGPSQTGIAKWAAKNPLHAAQFAIAHPAGYATQMAMETIGREWAKINPAEALTFAASDTSSFKTFLGKSAMQAWAEKDLPAAAEWLGSAGAHEKNAYSPTLVQAWAKEDASSALRWCESNLAGQSLSSAIAGVCKGVAEKDVAAAAALVNEMNPSQARGFAAAAVAEKWLPEYSSNKPVPPELMQWLATLDSSTLGQVLESTSWRWIDRDPKSLADFLAAKPDPKIAAHVYGRVARELARRDPAEAMAWSDKLPGKHRITASADGFSEWQRHQYEPALKWLNNLPKEDERRSLFLQNTIQSIAYEVNSSHKLALLSPTDRPAARNVIENMKIPEDRKSSLLQALENN